MVKHGGEWRPSTGRPRSSTSCAAWRDPARPRRQGHRRAREPHSTVEELFLAQKLVRALGSENIDYRLRNAEFPSLEGVRWLGTSIASLSTLQRVL